MYHTSLYRLYFYMIGSSVSLFTKASPQTCEYCITLWCCYGYSVSRPRRIFQPHYDLMGPPLYKWSITDWNVMWCMTVFESFWLLFLQTFFSALISFSLSFETPIIYMLDHLILYQTSICSSYIFIQSIPLPLLFFILCCAWTLALFTASGNCL